MAQVAISCVLLTGAALFARSLQTLAHLDAGFHPDNVLLLRVSAREGTPAGIERVRLYLRVLEHLTNVPGVRAASFSSESLFGGNTWSEAVSTPEYKPPRGQNRESVLLVVSPGFFHTLQTPILRGRDFDSHDDEHAPKAAIVNETAMRIYFAGADPVGQTFRLEHSSFPKPLTVVGLVKDAKYRSLREASTPIIYLPCLQSPGPISEVNLAVRTAADPAKMTDLLWKAAREDNPELRLGGTSTQAGLVNGTIAQDRMLAELSGFFGLAAAALVCLGLYGLTAYQVSRRTAEIGIRIALGAQRKDVVRLVLAGAMALVAGGVGLGLCAAFGLSRFVENLLFGVRGADAQAMLLTAAILLCTGAAAAYWPARRAARLDPARAIRRE